MPSPSPRPLGKARLWAVAAVLAASSTASHAALQLFSLQLPLTGVIADSLASLSLVQTQATPGFAYFRERDLDRTGALAPSCRIEQRRFSDQRRSYGSGTARQRQLLNACTPLMD